MMAYRSPDANIPGPLLMRNYTQLAVHFRKETGVCEYEITVAVVVIITSEARTRPVV